MKGSEVPIGIYTYDCLQDQQFPNNSRMYATYGYNFENLLSFNLASSKSNSMRRPLESIGALDSSRGLKESLLRHQSSMAPVNPLRTSPSKMTKSFDVAFDPFSMFTKSGTSRAQQSVTMPITRGVDITGTGVTGFDVGIFDKQTTGKNKFTTNIVTGTAVATKILESFERSEFQHKHDMVYQNPHNFELVKIEKSTSTNRFSKSVDLRSPIRFETSMSPQREVSIASSSAMFSPINTAIGTDALATLLSSPVNTNKNYHWDIPAAENFSRLKSNSVTFAGGDDFPQASVQSNYSRPMSGSKYYLAASGYVEPRSPNSSFLSPDLRNATMGSSFVRSMSGNNWRDSDQGSVESEEEGERNCRAEC